VAFNEKYVTVTGGGLHDGSSEANAWTWAEALANYAAGDRVNVKAGTYTHTTGQSLDTSGSLTSPVVFRGYKTSIGDMDSPSVTQRVEGTDIPLFTGSGGYIYNGTFYIGYITFQNFHFEYDTNSQLFNMNNMTRMTLIRCRVINTNTGTAARALYSRYSTIRVYNTYLKAEQNADVCLTSAVGSSNIKLFSSVIDGGNIGSNGRSFRALGCLFKNQSSHSIHDSGYGFDAIEGCTFYNSGGDFINFSAGNYVTTIKNCVFDACSGYAINCLNNPASTVLLNNAYHDSSFTSGRLSSTDMQDIEATTLTASPFVDAAANDFTISDTSNAYSPVFLMEQEGGISYRDIGAIQHQDLTLGGGSSSPTYTSTAGTQIYPFRTLAEDDFDKGGTKFHPLS